MAIEQLPVVSLFCGAGGLDLGFRRQGFRSIIALDNCEAAVKSYNFNTRDKVARNVDLSKASAASIAELVESSADSESPIGVIGGPPCQGFSIGNASADPRDPRNLLPYRYADILSHLNAKYQLHFFLFENVPGLLQAQHRNRLQSITRRFEQAGFNVFRQELNALSFGVPQRRKRLFIVGLNSDLYPDTAFKFPKGRGTVKSVRDAIAGLPAPIFFKRGGNALQLHPTHPNHWTMNSHSRKLSEARPPDSRSFRRLEWDKESPTVAYGNREIHVHPDGGRRLSIWEAMLLQGFPQRYTLLGNFSEQVTQVSNAVPPPMARALARRITSIVCSAKALP